MGIFSMIFGKRPEKDVHIHLHVDGILKLNGIGNIGNIEVKSGNNMKDIAGKTKVELVDSIPEMEPEELGDVEIPNVDFGDEEKQ